EEGARLPVHGDSHPLVGQRVQAQLRRGRWRGQLAPVRLVPDGVVAFVEVDQLPAVGQRDRGALHLAIPSSVVVAARPAPAEAGTTTSSPTRSASACRASEGSRSSVTSRWAAESSTIEEMPTVPHLVWSASTTSRSAAATRARSVSASIRFGVVN